MRQWVHYEHALPDDPDVDGFDCGDLEVDRYFASREWVKGMRASPPTFKFFTHDKRNVLGYAAISFRNVPEPDDAASVVARRLVIYAVGLYQKFHGVRNPVSGESYAMSVFRVLEEKALENTGCVGLSLWVRSDNAKAIAFYRKFGFSEDPTGPRKRDDGSPHLTMRKPRGV